MNRREAIAQIAFLAGGSLASRFAQAALRGTALHAAPAQSVFTAEQRSMVERLAELIIPPHRHQGRGIAVTDTTCSRDWYVATLGLKVEFEVPDRRTIALQDSEGFAIFLQAPDVARELFFKRCYFFEFSGAPRLLNFAFEEKFFLRDPRFECRIDLCEFFLLLVG